MRKLKLILEYAQYIAVIIGVPLFVWQQYETAKAQRVDRSLALAESLQSGRLSDARTAIFTPFYPYLRQLKNSEFNSAAYNNFVKKIVTRNPNISEYLLEIDYFLSIVSACTDENVCSESVNRAVFGEFSEDVFCLYAGVFSDLKEKRMMEKLGEEINRWRNKTDC